MNQNGKNYLKVMVVTMLITFLLITPLIYYINGNALERGFDLGRTSMPYMKFSYTEDILTNCTRDFLTFIDQENFVHVLNTPEARENETYLGYLGYLRIFSNEWICTPDKDYGTLGENWCYCEPGHIYIDDHGIGLVH